MIKNIAIIISIWMMIFNVAFGGCRVSGCNYQYKYMSDWADSQGEDFRRMKSYKYWKLVERWHILHNGVFDLTIPLNCGNIDSDCSNYIEDPEGVPEVWTVESSFTDVIVVNRPYDFELSRSSQPGQKLNIGLQRRNKAAASIRESDQNKDNKLLTVAQIDRSLNTAELQYSQGDEAVGDALMEMSLALSNLVLSFTPGVSVGKDIYEATSGTNLVTGEPLSVFDRGVVVLGVVTFGMSSWALKGEKLIQAFMVLEKVVDQSEHFGKTVKVATKYFKNKTTWKAPSGGTGINYKVYQREIDWNLDYLGKTNLQYAKKGQSPYVIKNGKYQQVQLHHSKQNGKGPLFEISIGSHQTKAGKGREALHPYGNNPHPEFPVDRPKFDKDRAAYWKGRAEEALK